MGENKLNIDAEKLWNHFEICLQHTRCFFSHNWTSKLNLDSRANSLRRMEEKLQLFFLLKLFTLLVLVVCWGFFSLVKQTCWLILYRATKNVFWPCIVICSSLEFHFQWNSLSLRVRMNRDLFPYLVRVKVNFLKWSMGLQLHALLWICHQILEWIVDIL